MEAAPVSINGWMDKEDMVYIKWNISHKKEWDLAICDNMDKPRGIMVSEISQVEKDKYYMISLTCGI